MFEKKIKNSIQKTMQLKKAVNERLYLLSLYFLVGKIFISELTLPSDKQLLPFILNKIRHFLFFHKSLNNANNNVAIFFIK